MALRIGNHVLVAAAVAGVASMAGATTVPTSIQGGLVGFYDASQAYSDNAETTLQTAPGGSIAALKNQGSAAPSGTDAFQPTAGAQPTLVAGLNGQSAIHFNGSSDFLTSALSTTNLGANGYTLFVVGRSNGVSASPQFPGDTKVTGGLTSVIRFQNPGNSYIVYPYTNQSSDTKTGTFIQGNQTNIYNAGLSDGGLSDGLYHEGTAIFRGINTPNGLQTYKDGASVISEASNGGSTPGGESLSIGAYLPPGGGAAEFTNGDVEAILIYNTALSDSDLANVNTFISATYLPEPSSLGVAGCAGLLLARRRRRTA